MPATIPLPDSATRTEIAKAPAVHPIIVATDGTDTSAPAFVTAGHLADKCGAPVQVVAVVEPLYMPVPYPLLPPLDFENRRRDDLAKLATGQLQQIVGEQRGWTVETQYGEPAPALHRITRDREADLLVTGLSRHGPVDRALGAETAAHIAQLTETPSLTVSPRTERLPRTVLVAISHDSPALPESAALRALFSEVRTVHMVNVQPHSPEVLGFAPGSMEFSNEDQLAEAVDRVSASLAVPGKAIRELVIAEGNPASEILRIAGEENVDLLVVAQRRRGLVRAWAGGGLAARLLRGTTCSVLVVPQPAAKRRGADASAPPVAGTKTVTMSDRSEWSAKLAAFTRANAGRRVALEIDDVQQGAQMQARDFPFLGADYDRGDNRVEIMLGSPAGGMSHLTHSIVAPTSLDLLEDLKGRAIALRVEDDRGQALLTFLP
jgi:nucleotide-binding universal stress UspA family protein